MRALDNLLQQKVSGIFLTSSSDFCENESARRIRKTLNSFQVPIVLIDRALKNSMWGVFIRIIPPAHIWRRRL